MERKLKIEKWQMRRDPYDGCFWLILYVGEENGTYNWCLGLNEHGNVARISIDIVRTWFLWEKNDDDVDKFLERLLNDLITNNHERSQPIKWQMKYLQTKRNSH